MFVKTTSQSAESEKNSSKCLKAKINTRPYKPFCPKSGKAAVAIKVTLLPKHIKYCIPKGFVSFEGCLFPFIKAVVIIPSKYHTFLFLPFFVNISLCGPLYV